MHCWARGAAYNALPLRNVAMVLEAGRQVCAAHDIEFAPFPMHEAAAHPDAPRLIEMFATASREPVFEPFVTTGVPLATRDDWPAVLDAAHKTGSTTLWTHIHGIGETHDRNMNRAGAFDEMCVAIERAKSMRFRAGCNVFVTKDNIPQVNEMMDTLARLNMDESLWEIASYTPHARMRQYEAIRPTLEDVLPVAERIASITHWPHHKAFWQPENLVEHTEASFARRALVEPDDATWLVAPDPSLIQLVCRPSLDLHRGVAGAYGNLHGNLHDDDAGAFERAVAHANTAESSLYFNTLHFPSIKTLAQNNGDVAGQKIHFNADSIAGYWLDKALIDQRRY
jgi:hypothetical protein